MVLTLNIPVVGDVGLCAVVPAGSNKEPVPEKSSVPLLDSMEVSPSMIGM